MGSWQVFFVRIRRLQISGNLEVNAGGDIGDELDISNNGRLGGNVSLKGFSALLFSGNMVGKNLTAEAGVPFDFGIGFTMSVGRSFVFGKATLKGSNQSVDDLEVGGTFFANDLNINLGDGADFLDIEDNFIGQNLNMDGGKGSDLIINALNDIGGLIKLKNFEFVF